MNFEAKTYQKLNEIISDVCDEITGFDTSFIFDIDEKIITRLQLREENPGINLYPAVLMTGWSDTEEDQLTITVDIDQLWIVIDTSREEFSEYRSEEKYNKILIPLMNEFEYRLKTSPNIMFKDPRLDGLSFSIRRREMLASTENEHQFNSPVDAIVYEGLQLQIIKNC